MEPIPLSIEYGGVAIPFLLSYRPRKSLQISVHPDGSVAVKAPLYVDREQVLQRVYRRARWIEKQIRYFAQFEPRTPKRRFVGGESHLYLGRKYRLKIERAEEDRVRLKHGYFYVQSRDTKPMCIATLLNQWYMDKARAYFPKVFDGCWQHPQNKGKCQPVLKIRDMKTRWGSLSSRGNMTLNLQLIKAPRECIEYVIIHELCHLSYHNHGADFYKLLDSMMPDWVKRKHKLEITLA